MGDMIWISGLAFAEGFCCRVAANTAGDIVLVCGKHNSSLRSPKFLGYVSLSNGFVPASAAAIVLMYV